jgi:hypothetical protein
MGRHSTSYARCAATSRTLRARHPREGAHGGRTRSAGLRSVVPPVMRRPYPAFAAATPGVATGRPSPRRTPCSAAERDLDVRWHLVDGRPVRSLVTGAGGPELVVVPGLGALGLPRAARARVRRLDPRPPAGPAGLRRRDDRPAARRPDRGQRERSRLARAGAGRPGGPAGALDRRAGRAARGARPAGPRAALVLAGATFPPQARAGRRCVARVLATLPSEQPGSCRPSCPTTHGGAGGSSTCSAPRWPRRRPPTGSTRRSSCAASTTT